MCVTIWGIKSFFVSAFKVSLDLPVWDFKLLSWRTSLTVRASRSSQSSVGSSVWRCYGWKQWFFLILTYMLKETILVNAFPCSSGINSKNYEYNLHPHAVCSNINLLVLMLAGEPSLYTQNHHIGQTTGCVSAWNTRQPWLNRTSLQMKHRAPHTAPSSVTWLDLCHLVSLVRRRQRPFLVTFCYHWVYFECPYFEVSGSREAVHRQKL